MSTSGVDACMYVACFYSCLLGFYMLINVAYTVTYFLPIPSTVPRTRARSELLNVSLVLPRVEFHTALPVLIASGVDQLDVMCPRLYLIHKSINREFDAI